MSTSSHHLLLCALTLAALGALAAPPVAYPFELEPFIARQKTPLLGPVRQQVLQARVLLELFDQKTVYAQSKGPDAPPELWGLVEYMVLAAPCVEQQGERRARIDALAKELDPQTPPVLKAWFDLSRGEAPRAAAAVLVAQFERELKVSPNHATFNRAAGLARCVAPVVTEAERARMKQRLDEVQRQLPPLMPG